MKFPVTVRHRTIEAKIYAPAKNFAYYRLSYTVAGKRRMKTFATYPDRQLSKSESDVRVFGIVFLPDGKTLLTYNLEQDIGVWDISSLTNIVSLSSIPGHLSEIFSLALAPNGQTLASGSKDGTIKLWSADVFQERPGVKDQLGGHGIGHIVFSKDGGTMFTISSNSSFGTWDTATLQPLTHYELPRDVSIAVISPQGNQVAAGLTTGAVQLWSVSNREKARCFASSFFPRSGR